MKSRFADGCAPPPAIHILGHERYLCLDCGIHEEGVEEFEVELKKIADGWAPPPAVHILKH